jgi:hypothetical protein
MQKQVFANLKKTCIIVGLAVASLQSLYAQDSLKTPPSLTFTYAGTIRYQPVFHVKLQNATGTAKLLLLNEDGDILYAEKFDGNYNKRFQVDVPATEQVTLVVKIVDTKGRKLHQAVVNNRDRNQADELLTKW